MNHLELLKKYIDHVLQCDGRDFLSEIGVGGSKVVFSSEEYDELCRIADEVDPL